MSQCATVLGASAPDRLARLIQKHVFGDRVKIPLEIRLWGGRTYRFGAGEPAVKILVKDRQGLSALRRLDELRICEAYMNGSLDVQGDMLGFACLRPGLRDRHPLHDLWQRVAPWFVGSIKTDQHHRCGDRAALPARMRSAAVCCGRVQTSERQGVDTS